MATCTKSCYVANPVCKCERDCYIGDPADYADCITACGETGCHIPDRQRMPSHGNYCVPVFGDPPDPSLEDDWLGSEPGQCGEISSDTQDAIDSCNDAKTTCCDNTFPCPDELELGCEHEWCDCVGPVEGDAVEAAMDCREGEADGEGHRTSGVLKELIDCEESNNGDLEECCDSGVGDGTWQVCVAGCEEARLEAETQNEYDYWQCDADTAQTFFDGDNGDFPLWDGMTCRLGIAPGTGRAPNNISLLPCWSLLRFSNTEPEATRIECLAGCMRAEMARVDPYDRKRAQCGGRYQEDQSKCYTALLRAMRGDGSIGSVDIPTAFYSCWQSFEAGEGEDIVDCAAAFYEAVQPFVLDYADCLYAACITENQPTYVKEFSDCWLLQWKDFYPSVIAAREGRDICTSGGGEGCQDAEDAAIAEAAATFYDNVQENCAGMDKGCPNCAKEATDVQIPFFPPWDEIEDLSWLEHDEDMLPIIPPMTVPPPSPP